MDCRTFALLLDQPEQEWTEEQMRSMEAHAAQCADCRMLLTMRREMAAMDDAEPVPAAFSAVWRNQIDAEGQKKMSRMTFLSSWKRAVAALAAVAVVGIGTAITYQNGQNRPAAVGYTASTSSAKNAAYEEAAEYDMGYAPSAGTAAGLMMDGDAAMMRASGDEAAEAERASKIIRTVYFTIKTQRYQEDYDALRQLAADFGGRIESLSASGDGSANSLRRAEFTLRIPSDRLDEFIAGAKGVGTVSSYSENSEDVSESYYDMQARLETQQNKLKRLNELMEKAEDIADLIELEGAISDTQYWIDYYTGRMRGYDSRVNDSYVYVTLREISSAAAAEVRELTLGERIVSALKASVETAGEVLQALVIFLISALPWIAALTAALVIVLLIVRRVRRKKGQKQE